MFINWCSSRKPQRAPVLHSPLVAYTCIMPRRLLHKKKPTEIFHETLHLIFFNLEVNLKKKMVVTNLYVLQMIDVNGELQTAC